MKYTINENENKIWIITALDNDIAIGSLQFYLDEDILHIKYIFVEEEYRQQGIGSGLILQANDFVKNNILDGMVFNMIVPKDERHIYERFLIKNDFHMPSDDGLFITSEINRLLDTYICKLPYDVNMLENRLYKMSKLPFELKKYFEKNIKNNIDKGQLPEYALGEIVQDLSFALEKDEKISSYVIFSIYENELYLNSAYIDSENVTELIYLLKYCFALISDKYKEYKLLKIKSINYEGYNLFKKLVKGAECSHEVALVTYKFF